MMRYAIALVLLTAGCAATAPSPLAPIGETGCPDEGRWVVPRDGSSPSTAELMRDVAGARVILLGEDHDRREDHRWQLQMVASIAAHRPDLILGLEMFPRSSQKALDDWSAGRLSGQDLIEQSRWHAVWGYPAELYFPIFHLARMNRYRMVGLNVDYGLIRSVSTDGWNALDEETRAGLTDPAPPSPGYRARLEEVFAAHDRPGEDGDRQLERFIEAQLTWDRAFAEAIRDALADDPQAVVVALVGRGHLENGYGVAHQLDDLGIDQHITLLPWNVGQECDGIEGGFADAVFGVRSFEAVTPPRRLGVLLEPAPPGLRIREVAAGSVAEAAGMVAGDVIIAAAGRAIRGVAELKTTLAKQPPGTVLPIEVLRGSERIVLDARFPAEP